ncbi:MAG: shikimate dehydrogenase [Candidatus Thorarchaeota archaeon]
MKRLLLIGNPVAHSMSPVMQNAALKAMRLNNEYSYETLEIPESGLREIVHAISIGEITGANVTAPYKTRVLQYLTRVESPAHMFGSVNTIFREGTSVIGCSTDSTGFLKALSEHGLKINKVRTLIIGAGGAARAVAFALAQSSASELIILNRTVDNARDLVATLKHHFRIKAEYGLLADYEQYLSQIDFLINCTPLGMKGAYERCSPIPAIPTTCDDLTVMDLVYNPRQTKLLEIAKEAGCKTIDGISMLVHQGAESLRIWTGESPPVAVMRNAVEASLRQGGPKI